MTRPPKVLIVGGSDVDARIPIMRRLTGEFEMSALGSSRDLHGPFSAEGFDYHHYHLGRGANPFSDLWTIAQLVVAMRRLRPHIVHTFDTKPGVWARLAAWSAGVPIVVGTLPGLGSLYAGEGFLTKTIRRIYEALQKTACRVSDLTIFQNHDDATQFVNDGVVTREKVAVISGSGISTDEYAPSRVAPTERERVRLELEIAPDATVITMISRVIRSKGVLDFMAAARSIGASHEGAHFLLVGSDDRSSVDRLRKTETEELRTALTWPGPRQDIPVVLAASDIFVLPSAYREGIPRVLLEAASMGLPIVTTDSPGCNEVVEHGINGYLVPVRDPQALGQAITELIEHPELRRLFGQASRSRVVERFDLSVVAEQTRSIYSRLLAANSRQGFES